MGCVEREIVDCFSRGGGVPYSAYPDFHQVMREMSGAVFDATLVSRALPLVEGLPARLEAGIDVADVGCGAGHAICVMAQAYPASRFVGFDFSEEAVGMAKEEAVDRGLTNATFQVRDAAELGEEVRFDLVTVFDAIHDQARPAEVLAGILRSLRPGGDFLCVDVGASSNVGENLDHPIGPFGYAVSSMHCMSVSLANGGEGLGAMWGVQRAREMITAAGFTDLRIERVEGDITNNYYLARRPS